nr:AAA family ATPase [uncultured Actinomyces sp.]
MGKKKAEQILSIKSLHNVGNWDYTATSHNTPKRFQRTNLIYGPNGSGKTSLANMSYGLAHDWPTETERTFGHVSLEVGYEDKYSRETNNLDDPIFSQVHVFTRDMVKQAHALTVDDATMSAILTLGTERVDRERRIAELEKALSDETEKLADTTSRREHSESMAEDTVSNFQNDIFNTLKSYKGWATKGKYNQRRAEQDLQEYVTSNIAKIDKMLQERATTNEKVIQCLESLDENEVSQHLKTLAEGEQRQLALPVFIGDNLIKRINTINALLDKVPNVTTLDTLKSNPGASNWVQQGIQLHEDSEQCIFCGARLSTSRMADIRAHFSHEVEELQARLRQHRSDFKDEIGAGKTLAETIARLAEEFSDNAELRAFSENYIDQLATYMTWISDAKQKIDNKLSNVMMASPEHLQTQNIPDPTDLINWINTYNDNSSRQAERKEIAETTIRSYYCARHSLAYLRATRNRDRLQSQEILHEDEIARIRDELSELRNFTGDPLPSAQSLNRRVSDLLGRDELHFEVDGDHYQVTRNGKPAVRLSEGEQTAITFVHFIEMIDVYTKNGGHPIVVIDDPVSSLDERIQYGVASMLRELMTKYNPRQKSLKTSDVSQLFVLTHNFDFFRYLYCLLAEKDRPVGPTSAYEIVSRYISGIRQPQLENWWVDDRKKMEVFSSYHYAFGLLGRELRSANSGTTLSTMDSQLLYPNLARRLLEQFLAFEFPHLATVFHDGMVAAAARVRSNGATAGVDPSEISQLITICKDIVLPATNMGSHNRLPTTVGTQSGQSLDLLIRQVFYFMHLVDNSHFEGMCKALEFKDKYELLPASAHHQNP